MNTDLWEFKYAPKTFEDIILNDSTRDALSDAVESLPNMTIAGPPGCGKGTFMSVLRKLRPDMQVFRINGSDMNGVDDVRDRIKPFAQGSFDTELRLVYINEADRLSPNAQDMLRDLIESVQDITRFILLCNYPERLTDELKSRCPLLWITNPPIKEIAIKCANILKSENVEFENKDVVNLVKSTYPDIRHTINMLKFNVKDGKLKSNIDIIPINAVYEDVLTVMKKGDPSALRKVLRSSPIDYTKLFQFLYDKLMDTEKSVFSDDYIAIYEVTEAAYRDNIVAIKEINFMGMYIKMLRQKAV